MNSFLSYLTIEISQHEIVFFVIVRDLIGRLTFFLVEISFNGYAFLKQSSIFSIN